MAQAEIKAVITADDRASHVIGGFGKSLQSLALPAAAVGAAITAVGVISFNAFSEAQKQSRMLEHAVVGVTHATQEQLQQTSALADALERKGVLDADNIRQGLAQLSTFGLSNKAVQDLGGSLADLAVNQFGVTATGDQLADSANMIAKALNGQFGILEKSGIRFTEAQKHMIEFGTETEKVTAINQGFQQNLKYTNDIAALTAEGALARLNVSFGNLQEEIGGVIAKALVPLVEKFKPIIDGIIQWTQNNPKLTATIVGIVAGIGVFSLALAGLAVAIGVVEAVGAPLIGIVAAILAVGAAIAFIVEKTVGWQNVWNGLVAVYNTYIKPALDSLWVAIRDNLLPVLQEFWDKNQNWIIPALQALGTILGGAVLAAILGFIYTLRAVILVVSEAISWITNFPVKVSESFNAIVGWLQWLANNWTSILGYVIGFIASIPAKVLMILVDMNVRAFNYLKGINWGQVADWFVDYWKSIPGRIYNIMIEVTKMIRSINWGDLAMGIGKGFVNSINGFIEGAINGALSGLPGSPKIKLPRFAKGVQNFGGGLAIVGERGPEVVALPRGSDVIPNNQIATSASSNTTININVGLMTGSAIERRDAAAKMFEDLKDIASSKGMSVGQMIGA